MTKKHKNQRQFHERSRWGQSTFAGGPGQKWTLWAAWAVIAVLVAGSAAYLAWAPAANPGDPAPTADATPAPAGDDEPSGVCGSPVEYPDRTMPPADLDWSGVHGNSWPVSDSTGPMTEIDGLGRCFEHSPVGAALAAVNQIQSLRTHDIDTAHRILDTQFVQNDGAAAAAADVDELYPTLPPHTRAYGRVMGYRVVAYTAELAQILLVESWPQRDQYTGFLVTLEWSGDDWQTRLQPNGQPSAEGEITVDPDGYTRWEAAG